ncbi:hypothetical protein [Aliamphritea spongicola]|uniref:hypothetical protein n=1 Tax=Aliamphritea spongicola TaxID=707589 RepID=UPI00196B0712|nr:hypothetical protein [Aliamphritea spongicola]MBN3561473.1 hypothetical protein [Aliamphritea spongicola]
MAYISIFCMTDSPDNSNSAKLSQITVMNVELSAGAERYIEEENIIDFMAVYKDWIYGY